MTDAEAEGRPFRDGYLEDLALLVGRTAGDPEVTAIADEVEAELAGAPASHPFLWLGRAVAPTSSPCPGSTARCCCAGGRITTSCAPCSTRPARRSRTSSWSATSSSLISRCRSRSAPGSAW